MVLLCEKCFPVFHKDTGSGKHHLDIASLVFAASQGCHVCEPLLESLVEKYGTLDNCLAKPFTYGIAVGRHIDIYMTILQDGLETSITASFQRFKTDDVASAVDLGTRNREDQILAATQISREWMASCIKDHNECPNNKEPKSYPTRLVQLEESTLRIIIPGEDEISGPYVALSYCWGRDPSLHLTAANLDHFRAGISHLDVPIAFQEAIHSTRAMQFRYLWIDALCIVQSGPGSVEDWITESAKMEDVYSNSIVTVALSSVSDPSQSCYIKYSTNHMAPFEVQVLDESRPDNAEQCKFTIIDREYFHHGLHSQPLSFRAWALQERLLSPRTLSFGMGEVFWDCNKLQNASECLPSGPQHPLVIESPLAKLPRTEGISLERSWLSIVEDYTARDLTYPEKDKLVALSAIAQRMATQMQDEYIVGHFWKTLPGSLNWKVKPDRGRRLGTKVIENHNSQTRNTPTWSWASNGPVFLEGYTYRNILAEAVSYAMNPIDSGKVGGRAESATVTIRTFCAEIEWRQDKPVVLSRSDVDQEHDNIVVLLDEANTKFDVGTRHVIAALAEDHILLTWEGLVLMEQKTGGESTYQRVGYFKCHSNRLKGPINDGSLMFIRNFSDDQKQLTLV